MRVRDRWSAAVMAGLALSLAGCAGGPLGPEEDRLEANRQLWRSQGIDSYRLTVRKICFCPPSATGPFEVRVVDGRIAAVVVAETGEPAPDATFLGEELTVEGLFRALAGALEDDPDGFSAEYDETLGHPRSASIDFEESVADEEMGFEVSGLTVGAR